MTPNATSVDFSSTGSRENLAYCQRAIASSSTPSTRERHRDESPWPAVHNRPGGITEHECSVMGGMKTWIGWRWRAAPNTVRIFDTAEAPAVGKLTYAQKKAIVAATAGTIVEIPTGLSTRPSRRSSRPKFFPAGNSITALLSVLAVFAVGFVMRPIGGAVLGVFADRHGRKKGLTFSILLMSVASFVIGVCPTYEQIGVLAPIILVLARLVQGFRLAENSVPPRPS